MNRGLKKHIFVPSCALIIGDRGSGKSSLMSMIATLMCDSDIPVYSQYPFDGARSIPMTHSYKKNGSKTYNVDKDWLYSTDLSHCCVLLDEASTIYPARSWNNWTQADSDFFNFIRHNQMYVFLATQHSDEIDKNVRRACDETFFLTVPPLLSHFNFSYVECSRTVNVKVVDKNFEIVGKNGRSGAYKVQWDIGEIPSGNFYFYRKPYYDKFNTHFMFNDKLPPDTQSWREIMDGDFSKKEIIVNEL